MAVKRKYIGILGDQNPIEHHGGVIFDAGHGPEVIYFQSYDDDSGDGMVSVYQFSVDKDVIQDLDWVDWSRVAATIGMPVDELKKHAVSDNVHARASVYEAVSWHYGFRELDSDPQEMTLKQAERKYGRWVDAAHRAQSKKKNPFKCKSNRGRTGRVRSGGRSTKASVRLANSLKR